VRFRCSGPPGDGPPGTWRGRRRRRRRRATGSSRRAVRSWRAGPGPDPWPPPAAHATHGGGSSAFGVFGAPLGQGRNSYLGFEKKKAGTTSSVCLPTPFFSSRCFGKGCNVPACQQGHRARGLAYPPQSSSVSSAPGGSAGRSSGAWSPRPGIRVRPSGGRIPITEPTAQRRWQGTRRGIRGIDVSVFWICLDLVWILSETHPLCPAGPLCEWPR